MKKTIFLLAICLALVSVTLTGCVKVVKIGEEDALIGREENAGLDVASFWDSQAIPEIEGTAVELNALLNDAGGDLSSQADKAHKTQGSNGMDFAVHGRAEVTEVMTEKKAGYITLKVDGYEGNTVVKLQVGTVFKQYSVRDYLSFINVNSFSDQIEYAQLAKNINNYILEHVIADTDVNALVGKTVDFYGCFTYEKDDEILITPVALTVE